MDENERPESVGEVVTPTEEGSAEQQGEERGAPQSHEDNRRFQAARLGGERAGYERAMRELAGRESEQREREEEHRRFVADDARKFARRFPGVNLAELDVSESFRRFCGSRYGREPLNDLYEDWKEFAGEDAAAKAVGKAAEKNERSTGAGGGGAAEGLTAAQQRALDEWNREYPQMKMTAREFLKR